MKIIGISGQTGAGKSTFAKILCTQLNGEYIDVDSLGHILLENAKTIKELTKNFGEDILTDSKIDRKKLGAKAFVSIEATETLNSIMHPAMVNMVKEIISDSRKRGRQFLIIDAALLYKMKLDSLCDKIIYVKANPEIRIQRLMTTRGWTEQRARERLFLQDQGPVNEKNVVIIENNDTKDDLIEKINSSVKVLLD